jgi:hypothetical protein
VLDGPDPLDDAVRVERELPGILVEAVGADFVEIEQELARQQLGMPHDVGDRVLLLAEPVGDLLRCQPPPKRPQSHIRIQVDRLDFSGTAIVAVESDETAVSECGQAQQLAGSPLQHDVALKVLLHVRRQGQQARIELRRQTAAHLAWQARLIEGADGLQQARHGIAHAVFV